MKNDTYLKKDSDLLETLSKIDPDVAYTKADKHNQALLKANTLALLRSRKSAHDTEQSNKRYSWVILIFSMVQICIATFQFGVQIFPPESFLAKVIVFGTFVLFVLIVFRDGFSEIKQKRD